MTINKQNSRDSRQLRVAVIVGSVRHQRLADAILPWLTGELGTHEEWDVDVVDLGKAHLPLEGPTPDGPASPIADRLAIADAFVVLTPEYNHAPPAALKNAIDWHFDEWAYKPVAFVGYGASSGGARAIEHLRLVFPELRATTIREALLLEAPWNRVEDGQYAGSAAESAALGQVAAELEWWAGALRAARHRAPALVDAS